MADTDRTEVEPKPSPGGESSPPDASPEAEVLAEEEDSPLDHGPETALGW